MIRDIKNELHELVTIFSNINVEHWNEGGVDFFKITNFNFINGINEYVLQVGNFMGYESRLFFPEIIKTKTERNWNHKDVLVRNKIYNAFSYRVPNGSLVQILLSHLGGAK